MRDLYGLLNVNRDAAESELAEALAGHPDLATVLLNPEKRKVYDSAHGTLKMIGSLRYRLGLDAGHSWFLENYAEFSPRLSRSLAPLPEQPADPQPSAAAPPRAAKRTRGRSRRSSNTYWLSTLLLVSAGLILAALAFYNR